MTYGLKFSSRPGIWRPAPPASQEALASLRAHAPSNLPAEYFELLAASNGGEGDLAVAPGWVALWPAEEAFANNRGYDIEAALPGFVGFGSNGGGELLAIDMTGPPPCPVVMVPFIPMRSVERAVIAPSFRNFLALLAIPMTGA